MSKGSANTIPDKPSPIIAREGWPIVAGFVLGSAALTWFSRWGFGPTFGWIVAVITGALTLWCIWFFRDPRRRIPVPENGREPVVSPADGVICDIKATSPPTDLQVPFDQAARMTRVSVFMNVFNVHVNRAPAACTVMTTKYTPGKFFNAAFDKASEHNERMALRLKLTDGREMACVQIAGLIARRIVCRVKAGDKLETGERFGIIRFGSRVDVYLPASVTPEVKIGDKVIAGETVIGWMPAKIVSTTVVPVKGAKAQEQCAKTPAAAPATSARR